MAAKNLRTLVEGAYKNSVSVQRHRIPREAAEEIRRIEREQGHNQACARLLEILFRRTK